MMRRLLIVTVMSLMLAGAGMARDVADLFGTEPGNIFMLLPRTVRLDMVDYYRSGQTVAASNNMGGDSQFAALDSVYLKLVASDARVVEMRMLVNKRDTVVMVIETVRTPVPDSRITYWDAQWRQINAARWFTMPTIDDFMTRKMPADLRADLEAAAPFPLVELTLAGDRHDRVVARNGLKQFLTPVDYKRYAPYMTDSLTYQFNGYKLKRVKP